MVRYNKFVVGLYEFFLLGLFFKFFGILIFLFWVRFIEFFVIFEN